MIFPAVAVLYYSFTAIIELSRLAIWQSSSEMQKQKKKKKKKKRKPYQTKVFRNHLLNSTL